MRGFGLTLGFGAVLLWAMWICIEGGTLVMGASNGNGSGKTSLPTASPTVSRPTASPTSSKPTSSPIVPSPTTRKPSFSPSVSPSRTPSTTAPSQSPSTPIPTDSPRRSPSSSPTIAAPSSSPTTSAPSLAPTRAPTNPPTQLSTASTLESFRCPDDGGSWIFSNATGRCYSYVSTPASYNNLVCLGLTLQADARLVDIRSQIENDIVTGLCNNPSNTACMETEYKDGGTGAGTSTCCCTGYSGTFTYTPTTSEMTYVVTDSPTGQGTCSPAPGPNKATECLIGTVYSGASVPGNGPSGMGACWIGGQRVGGTNADANVPVLWSPAVAGQSNNMYFTRWQNDLPPYPVPANIPSKPTTQADRFWNFQTSQLNRAVPRCVSLYHRTELGRWLVTWCERQYPSVCVVDALCPGSYNRTRAYSVSSTGEVTKGLCSLCPGGTYRPFGVKNELDCLNCGAGYYGLSNDPGRITSTCSGSCPRGTYCVAGTEFPTFCNPGTYGVPLNGTRGWTTQEEACGFCEAGYFCAGTGEISATPANQKCAEGRCGYAGATDAQCSSACKPGYYCIAGRANACPDAPSFPGIQYALECGQNGATNVYCPTGSIAPLAIPTGFFGYGGGNTNTTAGAIAPCTIGNYCLNGVRRKCPTGSYQDETGQSTCKPCRPGFFCPEGSTSGSQDFCAPTSVCPGSYYCPEGTTERLRVPDDKLALPVDSPANQKEDYTDCPVGQTCLCGFSTSYLSWNNASCPSGFGVTTIPELFSDQVTPFSFIADLIVAPQTENMTVTYSLVSQSFFDPSVTGCQSTVNDQIFTVDTANGDLTLARFSPNPRNASAALQYEACPPNAAIKYRVVASAMARDVYTGFNVSISCQLTVTVSDVNDQPVFPEPLEYRVISEKSQGNTPAGRCWNVPGCPDASSFGLLGSPEVAATDEDQFGQSALDYSFIGETSDCHEKFKINSCTGLISQKTGAENVISFNEPCLEPYTTSLKLLNFTVHVRDDGNGNLSNSLSDTTHVIVYIRNVNDPPMILNDSALVNLRILENALPGTATTPEFLSVYDEDEGDVLTQSILVGDSSAFTIEPFPPFRIVTTEIGASIIDFESAKKQYFVTIQVSDGQASSSKIFAISVVNVNEPPVFDASTSVFFLREDAIENQAACRDDSGVCSVATPAGISANRLRTSDPDALPTDHTTYSLVDDAQGRFAIHPTDGYIYLASTTKSIDFEDSAFAMAGGTGRGFRVTVEASSDGVGCDIAATASSIRNVTIYLVDVNERPSFVNPEQNVFRVPESWTPGQPLDVIISATDEDNADTFILGTLAPVQTLTFSLSTTLPASNSGHGLFIVANSATPGQARITLGSAALDFETAPICGSPTRKCYRLNIEVEDNGAPEQLSRTLEIELEIFDVNEPPFFTSDFTVTIPETISLAEYIAEIDTTASGVLRAMDVDAGDNQALTYDIVGGTGQSFFSLSSTVPGEFTVTKKSNTVLNYEQVSSWTLVIRARDQGGDSKVATACSVENGVDIGCQPGGSQCIGDRCYERCPSYSNETTNITSAQVAKVDTYFCQDLSGGPDGLVVSSVPFRESAIVTVTVQVLNRNDAPYVIDATFLGLARPDFRSNPECVLRGVVAKTLTENNKSQLAIRDISWFDEDSPGGPAAPIRFAAGSCVGFSPCLWESGFLLTNTTIGAVTLPGSTNVTLNTTYVGLIDIFDSADATSSCVLNITAVDSNFSPDLGPDMILLGVLENRTSPFVIVAAWPNRTLEDIDQDTLRVLNKDVLTFSMSLSSLFSLNRTTGGISLTGRLDYETAQSHVLFVRVADQNGADDVATLTVPVIDVNEPPFWTLGPLDSVSLRREYVINESTNTGFVVDNLAAGAASDPDAFNLQWSTLTYSLVSCSPGPCPFAVDGLGRLVVATGGPVALNFEGVRSWNLTLRVVDGGGLFADNTVGVSLLDINEEPTLQSGATLNVTEGASGTALLQLTGLVSDPDQFDPVTALVINITSGGSGVFVIENGVLRVSPNATLDYELQQNYTIGISVTDSGGLAVTGTFFINVLNVNDVTISSVTIVSGGQSATVLSCTGQNIVKFTGSNFGLINWTPATAANVSVTYRRIQSVGESAFGSSPIHRATNCAVVSVNNTVIECSVDAAGTGLGLIWTLTVVSVPGTQIASDAATITTMAMRYASPVVTSVQGVSAIPTLGNSTVTLSGSCLGRSTDALAFSQSGIGRDSFVEMFEPFSQTWKPLTSCSSTSPQGSTIVCTSVPGLGSNLRWRVSVAGQLFQDITNGSYSAPSIATVSKSIVLLTNGASSLVISGANFAPTLGAIPARVYLLDETYNLEYNVLGCTVTVPGRNVSCSSMQPGVGQNLKIRVIFAGLVNVDSSPTVSFQAPQVTQVQGDLSTTVGGDPVTLTGTSFGPVCGIPGSVNCPYVQANYSRGTFSPAQNAILVYRPTICAVLSQTKITCLTVAGTGANHKWGVRVAGQQATVSTTAGTTSYARPAVGAYDGPGASQALTTGNQAVILSGAHFGPEEGAPVTATYGDIDHPNEYTAQGCYVSTAHTEITCLTAPGAGKDETWTVIVDGQQSVAELSNYGVPVIYTVSNFSRDDGGELVTLTGLNFGPAGEGFLQKVSYGPVGSLDLYDVSNTCQVLGHSSISCLTIAGTGSNLMWRVKVRGQVNSVASPFSSYQTPLVQNLSVITGSTKGGYSAMLQGIGFALCDSRSTSRVAFGTRNVDVTATFAEVGATPGTYVAFERSEDCPLALTDFTARRRVTFVIPEMIDAHQAQVGFAVESPGVGTFASPVKFLFVYQPPRITFVYAEPGPVPSSVAVSVVGENFCKSELCCQLYLDGSVASGSVTYHNHDRITAVVFNYGLVQVRCPQGNTDVRSFDSPGPFVIGANTAFPLPSVNLGQFEFDTRGFPLGSQQEIFVFGVFFGAVPKVKIGTELCEVVEVVAFDCNNPPVGMTPNTIDRFRIQIDGRTCTRVRVRVPTGEGVNLPLTVESDASTSPSLADDVDFEFFSYGAPEITELSAEFDQVHPSQGAPSVILKITGMNFGPDGGEIIFGEPDARFPIRCIPTGAGYVWNHTEVRCAVPEGSGADLSVRVRTKGGRLSAPFVGRTLSYAAPAISSWTIEGSATNKAKTQGGETLQIIGNNFGRAYFASLLIQDFGPSPSVSLGSVDCPVINSNHTVITCRVPEGEGGNYELKVVQTGRSSLAAAVRFAYGRPDITFLSPRNSSTNATDPSTGERIVLTIIGSNFGRDELQVSFATSVGRLLLGRRSAFNGWNDFLPGTNHTHIRVRLPSYFGKNLNVSIIVAGQENIITATTPLFSYNPPKVTQILVSRRLSPQLGGDVLASSSGSSCSPIRNGGNFFGYYERHQFTVQQDGTSTRVHQVFFAPQHNDSIVACSLDHLLTTITVGGTISDLGTHPDLGCVNLFEESVNSVSSSNGESDFALPASFAATAVGTRQFGAYLTYEDYKFVFAAPVASSIEQAQELAKKGGLEYMYEVQAASGPPLQNHTLVPTTGCHLYEPYGTYRDRLDATFLLGGMEIPRICIQPALITVIGEDFGTDEMINGDLAPEGSLRVYLVDANGIQYEASTTTTAGNHNLRCPKTLGCAQQDTIITFQAPMGAGKGLRIRIVLGNQETITEPRIDYLRPGRPELTPGSVYRGRSLMSALGGETVTIRGDNLGYRDSPVTMLLNGRPCSSVTWVSGANDESGKASLRCASSAGAAGIHSIFLCVSNQARFIADSLNGTSSSPYLIPSTTGLVASEPQLALEYGESIQAWAGRLPPNTTYAQMVLATAVARCPPGYYGRIGEVCLPCPYSSAEYSGSNCPGGFGLPIPQKGFFLLEFPTNSSRASVACPEERLVQPPNMPDVHIHDSCHQLVKCVPDKACEANGLCAEGYQYQYNRCQAIKQSLGIINSTCRVFLDPNSLSYVGINADCRPGGTPDGQACSAENPLDCQSCQVVYDDSGLNPVPLGLCACDMPVRCALCSQGTHFRIHNECQPCPSNPGALFALFILVALACVALGYYLQRKKLNLAFLSIVIDYFQVLAILATASVPWPQFIRDLLTIFTVFLASIDIVAPECLIPNFEFPAKFYMTELMPLVALLVLILVHIIFTVRELKQEKKIVGIRNYFRYFFRDESLSKTIGIYVIIVYVLYLVVTKRALDVFNCSPLDPDDGYSYTTFSSLSCDGGGLCRCDEPGGVQQSLVVPAIIALVVYTFGFPCAVAYVLRTRRVEIEEDQYLRAHGVGDSQQANPRAFSTRTRFQLMYMHFKPQYSFWMLIIIGRKFGIAFASLMFRGNPTFQLAVILVILFFSFTVQVRFRPYLSKGEFPVVVKYLNDMYNNALGETGVRRFVELHRNVTECVRQHIELARKEKLRRYKMGGGFWEDAGIQAEKHIIRSRTEKYFFDLNAVETNLLGTLILVVLCGVMFDSHQYQTRPDVRWQGELIVVLVLTLLIVSLLYVFLVIFNELFPQHFALYCGKVFLRYQITEEKQVDKDDIVLDANPLFAATGPIGDRSVVLQRELTQIQKHISVVKRQNDELAAQIEETSKSLPTELDETVVGIGRIMDTTNPRFSSDAR